MRGLNGKPVILTGGASGIGREAALRLAQEGALVGIFDINARGAAATVEKIDSGRAKVYEVDISDRAKVAAAHAAFEGEFGPTQGLANVAGWDSAKMFLESDPAVRDFLQRRSAELRVAMSVLKMPRPTDKKTLRQSPKRSGRRAIVPTFE